MDVNVLEESGACIVEVRGEVDLMHSPDLRKHLLAQLGDGKPALLVDLAAVSYIDSSGVASLVEAFQNARKVQQPFCLVSVNPDALRVLELARLDKVFQIHPSREAGLAALA